MSEDEMTSTFARVAPTLVAILVMSTDLVGQVSGNAAEGTSSTEVAVTTYRGDGVPYRGNGVPWRRVHTRREETADRARVTSTVEELGVEGKAESIEEVISETTRSESGTVQMKRDRFGFPSHQRRLLETTQSEQTMLSRGGTQTVHRTWSPDVNGRMYLVSQRIGETNPVTPGENRTVTVVLEPGINEPLHATQRIERTERRLGGNLRDESAEFMRDMNGGWQAIATRTAETRNVGLSRHREETVRHRDANGHLMTSERIVSSHVETDRRTVEVIETYSRDAEGWMRAAGLGLRERVHRTTTTTADGGRSSIEEVEARNPAAPSDPLRVFRRSMTTVRKIGPARWLTELQVFELDLNGRMALVESSVHDTIDK
jgi:hypothetical protein